MSRCARTAWAARRRAGALAAMALVVAAPLVARAHHELGVVRVDEANHRVFVVAPAPTLESQAAIVQYLGGMQAAIAEDYPARGRDWSVSFFATPELADEKDRVVTGTNAGAWAAGYLAEFTRRSGVLVRHPAEPAHRTEVAVPLPD